MFLDQHPAGHFHMQRVAEPLAIVPMHSGSVGGECYGSGLLGTDFHHDPVPDQREAVRQILYVIQFVMVTVTSSPWLTSNFSRLNAGAIECM